jgi:uncharacterized membrane protein
MLNSFLIGLLGGQRAMTPLAAVSVAATSGGLPTNCGAPRFIAHSLFAAAASILALVEMVGDKQKTAPDRIVPIGLAARFITSAIAGGSLAPRRQRWLGAAVGGSTAVLASYPGWCARMAVVRRYGQTPTGLAEDALIVLGAVGILLALGRPASDLRSAVVALTQPRDS